MILFNLPQFKWTGVDKLVGIGHLKTSVRGVYRQKSMISQKITCFKKYLLYQTPSVAGVW